MFTRRTLSVMFATLLGFSAGADAARFSWYDEVEPGVGVATSREDDGQRTPFRVDRNTLNIYPWALSTPAGLPGESQFGETRFSETQYRSSVPATGDMRAGLSWSHGFGVAVQPTVTGTVFVGDETQREGLSTSLAGRPFYGIAVTGSVRLFSAHSPYVAFRMERPIEYPGLSTPGVPTPDDSRSSVTAGWGIAISDHFRLRAEASYDVSEGVETFDPDRGRVFFGTRFDF